MVKYFLTICILLGIQGALCAQKKNDTIPPFIKGKEAVGIAIRDTGMSKAADSLRRKKTAKTDSPYKVDSATRKKHDPRKATLYSTFLPGLGQIYNRKYWKLPLVYAAVGIPAYTYFDNKSAYKKAQYALSLILNGQDTDQVALAKVDPKLRTFVVLREDNILRSYRNTVRKYQDYSVLYFLLFWGLQIVDATVDAHLKNFDVSSELSLRVLPAGAPNNTLGMGLVFDLHKARDKPLRDLP